VYRNTGWLEAVDTTPAINSIGTEGGTGTSRLKQIRSVTLQSGLVVTATTFVDCSYEGDLLRLSDTE
jgi:hypothetical protein